MNNTEAARMGSHEKSLIINAHSAIFGANVKLISLMTSFELADDGSKKSISVCELVKPCDCVRFLQHCANRARP